MTARLDPAMNPGPACARCGTERHWTGSRWRCSPCYNAWQKQRRESLPLDDREAERVRANALRAETRGKWSQEQRDEQNARAQRWRESNRERHREVTRQWYRDNVERARAAKLAEYAEHPETFIARNLTRKARMRNATCAHGPGCVDAEFLADLYAEPCLYCGDVTTDADHFNPLATGGLHCRDNLVPACEPCNASKHARHPVEFLTGVRGDQ